MTLRKAIETARGMDDYALRDAVFWGSWQYLLAAIALGRRAPADLAGRRSAYCIPRTLPWWGAALIRREQRLRALLPRAIELARRSD